MAKDPYKYFRVESRELLGSLTKGFLALESGAPGDAPVADLLRAAHTLKGAARVVRQTAIADMAHAVEDLLAPYREGRRSPPPRVISEGLKLLDAMAAEVAALAPGAGAPPQPPSPGAAAAAAPGGSAERFETVRLEVGEVDALLDGVSETTTKLNLLRRHVAPLERATRLAELLVEQAAMPKPGAKTRALAEDLRDGLRRVHRTLAAGLEEQERELDSLREKADALRLLPAGVTFATLQRVVRDAAQSLGKAAEFDADGGDIRLDGHVLQAVSDALGHAARNAVGHGIEAAERRRAAGKDPAGRVRLLVARRGNKVSFRLEDDGGGVDVEAVKQAALRRGLISERALPALSEQEAVELVLKGNVSTAAAVTGLSGRGIGLDAVRETAARLGGEVRIRSERGRGTSLELIVPVTLSSVSALIVMAAGVKVAVPMDIVRAVRKADDRDVARSAQGESVSLEGGAVPALALAEVLGLAEGASPQRSRTFAELGVGERRRAFWIDGTLGAASLVVRPVSRLASPLPIVSSAALDADGNPILVLDGPGLLAAADSRRGPRQRPRAARRLPILVVDDSLTSRMLEQSILEAAGYPVETAVSAEAALEKIRDARYALLVVDVEMPGMDGFQLLEALTADPDLRKMPAILVTSRDSPEDLRRARQAGAKAYIVKSEFDQGAFLGTIKSLVG